MAGNSQRRGATRKGNSRKGPSVGSGGQKRQGLEPKGPTPKAVERQHHPAARRARAAQKRADAAAPRRSSSRRSAGSVLAGRNPVVEADTLYVAVSQSGETYDTLAAVQELQRKGGRVLGVVNSVGSAIARQCDGGMYLHAGPEISVTSTKTRTPSRAIAT